jgi:hypothetical protein
VRHKTPLAVVRLGPWSRLVQVQPRPFRRVATEAVQARPVEDATFAQSSRHAGGGWRRSGRSGRFESRRAIVWDEGCGGQRRRDGRRGVERRRYSERRDFGHANEGAQWTRYGRRCGRGGGPGQRATRTTRARSGTYDLTCECRARWLTPRAAVDVKGAASGRCRSDHRRAILAPAESNRSSARSSSSGSWAARSPDLSHGLIVSGGCCS